MPAPNDSIRFWQSLTTREIDAEVARDPVVILPLAAIEQHGPHLPLSTDLDIGLGLLAEAFRRLPRELPAWVLPPQAVGCSREHAAFPGTLSVSAPVLAKIIRHVGGALASHGVRRLVISNSHGGNRHAIDMAGLALRDERGMLVVKASHFDFPRPEGCELPEPEWRDGLHGGAVETAMMLHLRPDLVRTGEIVNVPSLAQDLEGRLEYVRPEGAASFSWLAADLAASGVVGDGPLANAAIGERLVRQYGAVLAAVIRDAKAFPLERLAQTRKA